MTGPLAPGIDGAKPALQWHFGGVPYPISKAIRLYYTFVRTWDGSNEIVPASILLGFQEDLISCVVPQPIPFVSNPTQTYKTRVNSVGLFGQFSNQAWASDQAVLASEATAVITRSVQQTGIVPTAFNALVQTELEWPAFSRRTRFAELTESLIPVDVDGPAQNSDSHHPFQYTNETLVNDQDKYGQVVFWYFAGKPYRLTKAMRIPLDPLDGEAPRHPQSFVLDAALGPDGERQGAVARTRQLQQEAADAQAAGDDAPKTTGPQGHSLFIGFSGSVDPGG